jgi:hypothetical protein
MNIWSTTGRKAQRDIAAFKTLADTYKEKVEFVSFAIDNDLKAWNDAIKKYEMWWNNISDMQGWNSRAVFSYGVNSFPYNIIFDEYGTIIRKGIKTKDIISFYVEYLVLAANKDEADGVVTGKLVGTKDKKIYHLSGISRSNAVEILGRIIGLMKKSRSECPELFGVSSIKFVLGSKETRLFSGGDYYYDEYDRSDFAVRKCFSNDPYLSNSENFVQTAEDIYGGSRCHWAVEEFVHDRT